MARSADFKINTLARVSYADTMFEARTPEGGKEPKYGCTLIWPKSADIQILKDKALEVAKEQWGDKALQWIKDGLIKSPLLDGDGPQGISKKTGERRPELVGSWFIRPSATLKYPPRVVDRRRQPITEVGGKFYSGCYGYAVVNVYAWDNPKNGKGLSCGIILFQVVKDGDQLAGGAPSAESYFEELPDDEEDSTAGKGSDGAAGLFG